MCDDTNYRYDNRTPAIFTAKIADFTHEDFTRNVNNVDIADLKIGPTNDTDHIFDVVFNAVWKRTIRQKGIKSLKVRNPYRWIPRVSQSLVFFFALTLLISVWPTCSREARDYVLCTKYLGNSKNGESLR